MLGQRRRRAQGEPRGGARCSSARVVASVAGHGVPQRGGVVAVAILRAPASAVSLLVQPLSVRLPLTSIFFSLS